MTGEMIRIQLTGIFHDIFDDDKLVISDITTASDIDEWDSLAHLSLIVAIEAKFNIKFSMDEVVDMQNVGNIIKIIEAKGK